MAKNHYWLSLVYFIGIYYEPICQILNKALSIKIISSLKIKNNLKPSSHLISKPLPTYPNPNLIKYPNPNLINLLNLLHSSFQFINQFRKLSPRASKTKLIELSVELLHQRPHHNPRSMKSPNLRS